LRGPRSVYEEGLIELASDGKAYLMALRVTRNRGLAEDAVQETVCQLLLRPPAKRDPEGLGAYFLKAARGNALRLARTNGRRARREEAYVRTAKRHDSRPGNGPGPDEVARAIREAVEALPLAEREAVSLCYEQGLTERTAAEVLAVPKSTLNRRVRRGLERMRVALAARGFAAVTGPGNCAAWACPRCRRP
jgi:RNA polymerase sigma-70 factor (ECF subfamily)